jgi:hypothetical protein
VENSRREKNCQKCLALDETTRCSRAGIGHLNQEHSLDRNYLKGVLGDQIDAILNTAGMNLKKLLRWLEESLRLIYCWLLAISQGVSRPVGA